MGYGDYGGDSSWELLGVLVFILVVTVLCGVASGAISLRAILIGLGVITSIVVLWFVLIGRTWL